MQIPEWDACIKIHRQNTINSTVVCTAKTLLDTNDCCDGYCMNKVDLTKILPAPQTFLPCLYNEDTAVNTLSKGPLLLTRRVCRMAYDQDFVF